MNDVPGFLREFNDGRIFFVFSDQQNGQVEQLYSTEVGEVIKVGY
jgi:hypothetical protein